MLMVTLLTLTHLGGLCEPDPCAQSPLRSEPPAPPCSPATHQAGSFSGCLHMMFSLPVLPRHTHCTFLPFIHISSPRFTFLMGYFLSLSALFKLSVCHILFSYFALFLYSTYHYPPPYFYLFVYLLTLPPSRFKIHEARDFVSSHLHFQAMEQGPAHRGTLHLSIEYMQSSLMSRPSVSACPTVESGLCLYGWPVLHHYFQSQHATWHGSMCSQFVNGWREAFQVGLKSHRFSSAIFFLVLSSVFRCHPKCRHF